MNTQDPNSFIDSALDLIKTEKYYPGAHSERIVGKKEAKQRQIIKQQKEES